VYVCGYLLKPLEAPIGADNHTAIWVSQAKPPVIVVLLGLLVDVRGWRGSRRRH
jgi:hypothetical protein